MLRLRLNKLGHEGVHGRFIAIGKKDRAGIRAEGIDEAGAIILLILARLFMLLDEVRIVILDIAYGHEATLDMGTHLLLVKIETVFSLTHQGSLALQLEEILLGLCIYHRAVVIGFGGQIDLCAVYMQKAARLASGKGCSF